jgi:hypothetical protein
MRAWVLSMALCCTLPAGAWAQVLKCTDAATGAVVYTDGTCAGRANSQQLMEKPTPAQLAELDAQAQRARAELAASGVRHARELEAERWQSQSRPVALAPGPAVDGCTQARHALEAVANYKYVTPQQSAERMAEAQRWQDQACAGRGRNVAVRYVRRVQPAAAVRHVARRTAVR